MIKIGLNMENRVFSESVMIILQQTGNFKPVYFSYENREKFLTESVAFQPDIFLFDVRPFPEHETLENRMTIIKKIREGVPDCKIALICDETAFPELAVNVMRAKQMGAVDAFFYESVTAEYLIASLYSL